MKGGAPQDRVGALLERNYAKVSNNDKELGVLNLLRKGGVLAPTEQGKGPSRLSASRMSRRGCRSSPCLCWVLTP